MQLLRGGIPSKMRLKGYGRRCRNWCQKRGGTETGCIGRYLRSEKKEGLRLKTNAMQCVKRLGKALSARAHRLMSAQVSRRHGTHTLDQREEE
jgi:hypothetical protein